MATYQIENFGRFLKNPQKYKGDVGNISMRSGWEIKFATWLDNHPSVLEWSSEEYIIPYKLGAKNRRYFVDFWMKVRKADGDVKEYLIEIKPYKETQPPPEPKKKTRSYYKQVTTYVTNQAKWEAATAFCRQVQGTGKDLNFVVLTEKDIPV